MARWRNRFHPKVQRWHSCPASKPESFDGGDDLLQGNVAALHQRRVETGLRAIVVGIEIAIGSGVAASMLIVTLIRSDEGKRGNVSGGQVGIEAIRTNKTHGVGEIAAGLLAFLNAAEIRRMDCA